MSADWIFDPPPPSGARKGGLANAQVFDPDLDSLVREALQNARDQRATGEPVRVTIALRELTGSGLDAFLDAIWWDQLHPHIESAEAEGGVTIRERLRVGLEQVSTGRLRLLSIDDHGTVGLTGGEDEEESNFNALCRHELVTSSERRQSGGSFGIGKSVLWRFSGLSTVLFGSRLAGSDGMRFFGRALLTSHETADGAWEGSGWLGAPEKRPGGLRAISLAGDPAGAIASAAFVDREAGDSGTSILILAFDEPALEQEQSTPEACESMVESATRWFWPAMVRDEMRILVEGWQDDEQVFAKHVHPTAPEVLPFVEARFATPEVDDTLDAPGEVVERELLLRVPAQRPDVVSDPRPAFEAPLRLRIRQAESGEKDRLNCIALQRGAGMVVAYREIKVRSNVDFGFHGVLEAGLARGDTEADRAAEEFLRAAEPPAHEEWTHKTDRIRAEYGPGAKAALDHLFAAIEAAVKEFTREETVETDEGPDALRKLFPLPGIGPVESTPFYRLKDVSGAIDDGRWTFSGTYARREEASAEWQFRLRLLLDQETGGGGAVGGDTIPVDSVTVPGCTATGPEPDGSFVVTVPSDQTEASFEGVSAEVSDLPSGGLHRVRLRLDVKTLSPPGGGQ